MQFISITFHCDATITTIHPQNFSLPQTKAWHPWNHSPPPAPDPSPVTLATILHSGNHHSTLYLYELTTECTAFEWNCSESPLLCLASFIYHIAFNVHPYCSKNENVSSIWGWILHCMYFLFTYIYPLLDMWAVSTSWLLWIALAWM